MGAAVAAMVLVGGVASALAIRASRAAAVVPRTSLTAVDGDPRAAAPNGAQPDPASSGATDEDGVPMVMDLPETPGQHGGAQRSRNGKPGKPQRPKFLNTRE
jgi:hypothetical protein